MSLTSLYPVLMSANVGAAVTFYREAFGFTTTFESDWYVSLRLGSFELAVLAHDHPTIPAGRGALPAGVLVNLEVADVDAVHRHLTSVLGHEPVQPLRDEAFGQRHFIALGPDGVLLDVIQPIPFAAEYAGAVVAE